MLCNIGKKFGGYSTQKGFLKNILLFAFQDFDISLNELLHQPV